MSIKVKFYSLFRINLKSAGTEFEVEQPVVISQIIKWLDEGYEGYFSKKLLDKNEIRPGSIILVNGKNVLHLNHLQTRVNDGDTVTLFPPSAGG